MLGLISTLLRSHGMKVEINNYQQVGALSDVNPPSNSETIVSRPCDEYRYSA